MCSANCAKMSPQSLMNDVKLRWITEGVFSNVCDQLLLYDACICCVRHYSHVKVNELPSSSRQTTLCYFFSEHQA